MKTNSASEEATRILLAKENRCVRLGITARKAGVSLREAVDFFRTVRDRGNQP